MAIFDKLNDIAKAVGDKTGDAIEITKLNAKISSEKSAINDLYRRIGEACYVKYKEDSFSVGELGDLFAAVDGRNASIAAAEAQIELIKDASKQSVQNNNDNTATFGTVCPSCGTANEAGTSFCVSCGTKLDTPAAVCCCPACGIEVPAGARFCCKCGAKLY